MNKKEFNKKYRGVKMYKFVPLLESELRDSIRRRLDWTMTALSYGERYEEEKVERRILLFLQTSLICFLCFLLVMFNLYMVRILT